MEVLFTIIPIGLMLSLASFFFFERRAIVSKRQKEASGTQESGGYNIFAKFDNYDTQKNVLMYFLSVFIFTLVVAKVFYDPSYGLVQALLYIFLTSFFGSAIIFVIKYEKNLLIKVFATFLYGVPQIFAASLGFLAAYLIS